MGLGVAVDEAELRGPGRHIASHEPLKKRANKNIRENTRTNMKTGQKHGPKIGNKGAFKQTLT